jgi:hypothetical protein
MRSLRIIGPGALSLLIGLATFAQNPASSKQPNPTFKHHAEIVSVYDKAKDETAVVMHWYRVSWPSGTDIYNRGTAVDQARYELSIQAAFSYPGRSIKTIPANIQFEVRVWHPGKSFFRTQAMPELTANVNREQISLGRILLVKTKTFVDIDNGRVSIEHVSAFFTYQGLRRLIEANEVTMSAGDLTFSLKDHHLEALRDLASRMSP